jgi:hypothetical protein
MQQITLAQLECAIGYWRRRNSRRLLDGAGASEERCLAALYGRMLRQRMSTISVDGLTSLEIAALRCLYDVVESMSRDLRSLPTAAPDS